MGKAIKLLIIAVGGILLWTAWHEPSSPTPRPSEVDSGIFQPGGRAGAPTELDIQLARCETHEEACPGKRAGDHPKPPGVRRISEGGVDYGACYGGQEAVFLVPEPCDKVQPQNRPQ